MVEIADIKDEKSLEAWLNALSGNEAERRRIAVTIAHRAAMRVLPVWWEWTLREEVRKTDVEAMPILRASLRAGVSELPAIGLKDGAYLAADAAIDSAAEAFGWNSVVPVSAANSSVIAASVAAGDGDSAARHAGEATSAAAANASPKALAEFWSNIRTDYTVLVKGGSLNARPLWAGDNPLASDWQRVREHLPHGWTFWRDWYQGALDGHEPDRDMLEQIALIEPEVWDAGPGAVNARIALIVEQRKIAADVRAARGELAEIRAAASALAQRSHNNPPELVDADAQVTGSVEIIWAALDEAEEELEKSDPDPSRLKSIGIAIWNACKGILRYCAELGDAALTKATEEFGSAGAKWTVRGLVAYFALQSSGVQTLAERIIEFADKLAQLPR